MCPLAFLSKILYTTIMKIYETKTVPAREVTNCVGRTCDLCGHSSKSDGWNCGIYEVNETTVSVSVHQKEGSSYPEGGSGTEYDIDLCPVCFKNELVPWLKSRGAKNIQEKEWDW